MSLLPHFLVFLLGVVVCARSTQPFSPESIGATEVEKQLLKEKRMGIDVEGSAAPQSPPPSPAEKPNPSPFSRNAWPIGIDTESPASPTPGPVKKPNPSPFSTAPVTWSSYPPDPPANGVIRTPSQRVRLSAVVVRKPPVGVRRTPYKGEMPYVPPAGGAPRPPSPGLSSRIDDLKPSPEGMVSNDVSMPPPPNQLLH